MSKEAGGRRAYVKALVRGMVLAFLAQAGRQSATQGSDRSSEIVPRMKAASGAGATGSAATGSPSVFETGRAAKHDVSAPLRSIKPVAASPWSTVREMPERDGLDSSRPSAPVKDPVVQSTF